MSQNNLIWDFDQDVLYFDLVRIDAFIDFHESNACINILKASNVCLGSFMFAVY